ncbi:MAG: M56 family metallopeptidase [Actinomycetota bacterium]
MMVSDVGAWAAVMARAAWEGGLAILLVWGICRFVSGIPPATRCWVWRLVYLKLVISLCWAAPLNVPVLPGERVAAPGAAATSEIAPRSATQRAGNAGPPREQAAQRPPAARSQPAPMLRILFVLWLLGVAVCTGNLAAQLRRMRSLRCSCQDVVDAELLRLRAELCRTLGIRVEPPLISSGKIERPVLMGIRNPVVALPSEFLENCSANDQRLILAHELAHLRRRDLRWEWLRIAGRTLFFFHPLVRLADAEWRLAQELACDELTLRATSSLPGEYGRLLLRVATDGHPGLPTAGPALGISEAHANLRRRLRALGSLRPLPPVQAAAATMSVAVLALIGVVPWRAVASSPVGYLDLREAANHHLEAPAGEEYKPGNDLAALPRGEQVFAGFRFNVGNRYVQLGSKLLSQCPDRIGPIRVNRRCSTVAVLHGTLWGNAEPGEAHHVEDGTLIGEYIVHFAGGTREVIPIIYGQDVRDWWIPKRSEDPMERGRLAWVGQNSHNQRAGFPGIRLYVTEWKNPRPHERVSHIEYSSMNTLSAPFCVALTCGN